MSVTFTREEVEAKIDGLKRQIDFWTHILEMMPVEEGGSPEDGE